MRLARVDFVFSFSVCLAGALSFVELEASAQEKRDGSAGSPRSSAQVSLQREQPGGPDAERARARARAGDCAGALPGFDAAIQRTIEPSLRRDRGLCHETLGHPFPAMEDYRAYLTARPDAPDAEQIRQRLAALEGQTGHVGSEDTPAAGSGIRANLSVGGGASASASTSTSSPVADVSQSAEPAQRYEQVVAQEQLTDAAEASPLRNGSGFVLGPFLHMPRFFVGERARDQLGYGVGLALRYSTGRMVSVMSEIGYAGMGTSGAASAQSGPLLLGGIELRLPVSRFAADHVVLRGGVGYERHVVSGTRAVNDNVLGRFGVGYRHVFGPSIGLEILADGGPAYVIPENEANRINFLLGGSVAFLVGF